MSEAAITNPLINTIIRAVSKLDPANSDSPNTLSVSVQDLQLILAQHLSPSPCTSTPCAKGGDWSAVTTASTRLGDVLQLLCSGNRPSNITLEDWLDGHSDELQQFCADHGPAWAQGIGLIDLAMIAVRQPTEGVDHEHHEPAAEQAKMISELESSLQWYTKRVETLQANQRMLRDPERTIVCDIIANGSLLVNGQGIPCPSRYRANYDRINAAPGEPFQHPPLPQL